MATTVYPREGLEARLEHSPGLGPGWRHKHGPGPRPGGPWGKYAPPSPHPQHIHNLGCPWRRQEVVHSPGPASLPQHAWAGRRREGFPSMGRTTQGTPLSSKLPVGGALQIQAWQLVWCEARAQKRGGNPHSVNMCPSWPHSISAHHARQCSAPRQRALGPQGGGPRSPAHGSKGLGSSSAKGSGVDVPPHCQAGHQGGTLSSSFFFEGCLFS